MTEVLLKEEEKQQLLGFFEKLDLDTLKITAQAIAMMVRAFEGQPIEPEDVISRLTNIKNLLERSRFPTYPLLAKQVYLRLIALYNPQAYACRDWADLEAEALISYKGQSREEYVEMARATAGPKEQQQFYFGGPPVAPKAEAPVKRHFWSRAPKEESEFASE
ncbi:MAG: hypothetical protein QHH12_08140 [Candidatus Bathyarchaeota archaeon]|nr:hypothetical protein [Candidatus Bathyarchaeota archaeon]